MLVTSIFYLSHNVFSSIGDESQRLSYVEVSSANAFNFVWSEISSFDKESLLNQIGSQHFLLFSQCFQNFVAL